MRNDPETRTADIPNSWIAVDHSLGSDRWFAPYILVLKGDHSLYQAIAEHDWVLVLLTVASREIIFL